MTMKAPLAVLVLVASVACTSTSVASHSASPRAVGTAHGTNAAVSQQASDDSAASSAEAGAKSLCRKTLRSVVWAQMTTVGEARALTVGPDDHPAATAFPGALSTDPAAWCWTDTGPATPRNSSGSLGDISGATPANTYDYWAVGPTGVPFLITSVDATTAARGPGAVP
jgi:hypothetical protein